MAAKQCFGLTLRGLQCKRLLIGADYCYQHIDKNQDDNNPQQEIIKWTEPLRDATYNDIFIFELLVMYVSCYIDLLNLCLASKRFSERMKTNTFNESVKTLIEQIYSINISSTECHLIPKYLGCANILRQGYIPTPMNLFNLISQNHKTKKEVFCTRTGKVVRLIVSGMEMLKVDLFHCQFIISKLGTGRFFGFDETDGSIWCCLDNDYQTKIFADEVVSCWRGVKTREDAAKSNVIILNDTESLESFC